MKKVPPYPTKEYIDFHSERTKQGQKGGGYTFFLEEPMQIVSIYINYTRLHEDCKIAILKELLQHDTHRWAFKADNKHEVDEHLPVNHLHFWLPLAGANIEMQSVKYRTFLVKLFKDSFNN